MVRARRELLCLGAVQSPQLLELSGVGDPALLARLGIPLAHALPQVGENYIDHYATRMNWRVKNTVTLNEMSRGWRLARQVARYALSRRGILTLGTGLAHGFVKSAPQLALPDVQFFFVHASYANAAERILDRFPGMTIGVAQLRPESVGSIHAVSADPLAAPAIRPNFLAARIDRDSLVGGMRAARRIVSAGPAALRGGRAESGQGRAERRRMAGLRAPERPDHLSPDRHLPHGRGRGCRDGFPAARERAGRPAGGGRLGHAEDGVRQYPGRRDDGGRTRRRADPGGRGAGGLSRPRRRPTSSMAVAMTVRPLPYMQTE